MHVRRAIKTMCSRVVELRDTPPAGGVLMRACGLESRPVHLLIRKVGGGTLWNLVRLACISSREHSLQIYSPR